MNFDHVKKTVAKKMRLGIAYKSESENIVYVDKNLLEAQEEYTRLVSAVDDCIRLLRRGPKNQHIAYDMAIFVLAQAHTSPDNIKEPKDLAKELGRLNGILEEARRCTEACVASTDHFRSVQFNLLYRQTARKRDKPTGWNRSAIDPKADEAQKVNADVEMGFGT